MECNRITFGNSAASLAVSKAFCVKNSYDWSMIKIRCGFCFIQAVKTSFSLTSPVGLLGLHNHINLPLSGKRFKLYIGTTFMTMQTTSVRIFAESGHQDSRNLIPECLSY